MLGGVDGAQELGEVAWAGAEDDAVSLDSRPLTRQGHVWGEKGNFKERQSEVLKMPFVANF